ncbi:MAG: ABC transporter ATP-binding protein [Oscillospiraceae bacterium]|nr:ABC transporter ATP-binding protein [Oscillospiraceae bacterium]MDD4369075.1 ABC transporter ATP-binding protein [Oscillospiraceae bacterium]
MRKSTSQGGKGPQPHPSSAPLPSRRQTLLRLWRYIRQYRWQVTAALLLSLGSNLLALLGPVLSGRAIDALSGGVGKVNFPVVYVNILLMLSFFAISSLLNYLLSRLMIHLSQGVTYQLRKDAFNHMLQLPLDFFDRHQAGDIVSCLQYDIDTVNASLSTDLLQLITSLITVLGSLAMMLYLSPLLLLVFAVTVPAAILLTRYITHKVRPLFRARSVKLGQLNGYVEELITGQKTIQVYDRQQQMLAQFEVKNQDAVNAYYKAEYYGSITGPCVNFINNLSLALVSVFGAVLYLWGQLSLGKLSAFVLYSRKFSGPINEAANIFSELQSSLAAADRVFRLLDQKAEPADAPGALTLEKATGLIKLDHVSFSYVTGQPVIHDLSIQVRPGQTLAIVGPTGAGKTTLVNLLMRFYDPQAGFISLDGHDIRQLTRRSLRRSFSMVLQNTWLFQGSIFDNLAYGNAEVTLADVQRAAQAVHLDEFIQKLPGAYAMVLDDNASNLSQGQKQLLTIARAMLLDAPVLILDEATSNVDTQTEQLIYQAMEKLMSGRTSIVIAHRLSTIERADQIIVIQDGQIIEQGKHRELLAQGGFYARLYQSQFR